MNVFMLTWLRVLALIDAIRNKRWSGNGRPTPVAVATALRGGSSRSTPWNRHRPYHHRNRNLRA
jgi:hypothetical protein